MDACVAAAGGWSGEDRPKEAHNVYVGMLYSFWVQVGDAGPLRLELNKPGASRDQNLYDTHSSSHSLLTHGWEEPRQLAVL